MATGPGNPLNITGTGAISFNGTVFHGGTLPVIYGGTGNTTFTAFSVIIAGTTATNPFQNVSGLGTSGQVLTSNGAGTLPTWQASGGGGTFSINVQSFNNNGTYTPTAGMVYCRADMVGGGGGGGGSSTNPTLGVSAGSGGGGGGYTWGVFPAATIGASKTVTIGAGGTGGSPGGTGTTGGTSSFGSLLVCTGGSGGTGAQVNNTVGFAGAVGGAPGIVTSGGNYSEAGSQGLPATCGVWISNGGSVVYYNLSGAGGACGLGLGGTAVFGNNSANSGTGFGAGGGGAAGFPGGGGINGANGSGGFCIVTEYIT